VPAEFRKSRRASTGRRLRDDGDRRDVGHLVSRDQVNVDANRGGYLGFRDGHARTCRWITASPASRISNNNGRLDEKS
jgi:hypothetical protein